MEKRSIAIICSGLFLILGFSLLAARGIFGFSFPDIGAVFQKGSVLIVPRTAADKAAAGEIKNNGGSSRTKDAKARLAAKKEMPVLCAKGVAVPTRDSIIINEVAWMGSPASYADEWIELKNISAEPVDLAGWQLQNAKLKIKVFFEPAVIAAGGLYLLERTDDESAPEASADLFYTGSLANSGEGLFLFDSRCGLRDKVEIASEWPAGDNVSKITMERTVNFRWISSKEPGGTPKGENGAPLNGNIPAI
jgi:hypothetical protein